MNELSYQYHFNLKMAHIITQIFRFTALKILALALAKPEFFAL